MRGRELAAGVNPFRCGTTWAERAHLPEAVFRDFIADAGIDPPTFTVPDVRDKQGKPPAPVMQNGHRVYSGEEYEYGLRVRDAVNVWWALVAPGITRPASSSPVVCTLFQNVA